jgi:c-di-GMP-binding flagellar brake protein YcgR
MRGIVVEPLDIVDMSVGGFGLLLNRTLERQGVGSVMSLRVTTPRAEPFDVAAVVRHISVGTRVCGVEFCEPSDSVLNALRDAVGELLQRGALA